MFDCNFNLLGLYQHESMPKLFAPAISDERLSPIIKTESTCSWLSKSNDDWNIAGSGFASPHSPDISIASKYW